MSVTLVRAWAITVMGVIGIFGGIWKREPSWVMVGFAVLGSEPQIRSVARNGFDAPG